MARARAGNANPTFNPVAKPGAFHETLKALAKGELPTGPRYGELAPLDRAFMYRDERIQWMDEQNLERMFIYPTIGYSCEHMFANDWQLLYDFFHAFNALGRRRLGLQLPRPDLRAAADPDGRRGAITRRAGVGDRAGRVS